MLVKLREGDSDEFGLLWQIPRGGLTVITFEWGKGFYFSSLSYT